MPNLRVMAIAMLASSCVLMSRGDPTRFYVLKAADQPSPGSHGVDVGLGPITLPGYLKRPTLATRVATTDEVRYSEFDRWAEPLATQFQRTLGQELGSALGTDHVVTFPWYSNSAIDVAVRVNVVAFETDTAGNARLDARWTIRDPRNAAAPKGGRSLIIEPVAGDGPDAAVAALSRTVTGLAQQIAAAIPRR